MHSCWPSSRWQERTAIISLNSSFPLSVDRPIDGNLVDEEVSRYRPRRLIRWLTYHFFPMCCSTSIWRTVYPPRLRLFDEGDLPDPTLGISLSSFSMVAGSGGVVLAFVLDLPNRDRAIFTRCANDTSLLEMDREEASSASDSTGHVWLRCVMILVYAGF